MEGTLSQAVRAAATNDPAAAQNFLHPLNALDTFIQELQRTHQPERQISLLLQTILEALHADTVFLLSMVDPQVFHAAGKVVSPDWCRQALRELMASSAHERSQLMGPVNAPAPADMAATTTHAALIQLSKSRKTWVAAVRFDADDPFGPADNKLMVLARRLLLNHSRQLQTVGKLKETLFGLVHCLTAAIDAKDPYTCGHSERVGRIATRLGQAMNLPEAMLSDLYLAGLLHDVGKIGVEDRILRKPGKLTDEEILAIQAHPVIGDRIVSVVRPLAHLRPGVRNHHERFDGNGYPDRLVGLEIPLLARILAVADSCDAMMSARPYRPAMAPVKIEAIFADEAGRQWDPQVVEAFVACRKDLYGIGQRGIGDSLYRAVGHAIDGASMMDHSMPENVFAGDAQPTA
jgi:HD-GYP domain-containing protein (c-di-GMP phosphodiesterase class II)